MEKTRCVAAGVVLATGSEGEAVSTMSIHDRRPMGAGRQTGNPSRSAGPKSGRAPTVGPPDWNGPGPKDQWRTVRPRTNKVLVEDL